MKNVLNKSNKIKCRPNHILETNKPNLSVQSLQKIVGDVFENVSEQVKNLLIKEISAFGRDIFITKLLSPPIDACKVKV